MNDNEARIKITADASGVQAGIEPAKSEVASLAPLLQQLNAQFALLSDQIKSAMAGGTAQTKEFKQEVNELEQATEREAASLKEMALRVHEGVESFNGFKRSIMEFAEVYMAAFAIERIVEWSKEIGEANEKIVHLAQTFGITTRQVQQLQGIAETTGMQIEVLTKGFAILDKNMVNAQGTTSAQANAFKQLGISIDDGKSQMEKFEAIAEKFSHMDDGPKKVALAMELFGKSGAQLIPILNMGADGLEELNKKAEEYGVTNDQAVEAGNALADTWDENLLAMTGLTNVLTQEFAPGMATAVDAMNGLIKDFIQSYKEGGAAKQILEDIGVVGKVTAVVLVDLGAIVVAAFEAINGIAWMLTGTIAAVIDSIIASFKMLWETLKVTGQLLADVFTLNWGAIVSDFRNGMDQIANAALEGGRKAGDHFKQGWNNGAAAFSAGDAAMSGADRFANAMFGNTTKHEEAPKPKGSGDFEPHLGATHAPKATEKSRFDDWEGKLEEAKLAWSQLQDAQGSAQDYSLQSEADYWNQILQRDDLTHKERLAVLKAYLAAHSQLTKEAIEKQVAAYRTELDEAKGNSAERMRIATEEAAYIGQKYGLESKEYKAAQDQIVKIKQEAARQLEQINTELTKSEEKLALGDVAEAENAAKFRVQMGEQTEAQLIQQQRAFENQRFQIQQQSLARQKGLIDPLRDPVRYQQLSAQIQQLEQQHQQRLTQIDRQAVLQRTQIQRNAITQTGQVWGQNIARLITLQQGFASTVRSIYFGMVDIISNALASVIQKWLEQQLAALLLKRAAQSVDGAATVASNAAVAGSAAFASTAAIPIIGPELAPGAAAAAYAATMAFAPLASAEGGDWKVRAGLYQLHADEMVLPAWAAGSLRDMLSSPGNDNGAGIPQRATGTDGPSTSGGDFHFHDHTGTMTPSQIMANRGALAKAVKQAHREGHFSGFKFR